ncbi:RES domain-containing protein, partial [Salmonella enterica]|nr:RES domain-containing protein [Salmonella enterica]
MIRMCCAECFNDNGLRNNIIPTLMPQKGNCSFCNSQGVDIIDPKLLLD